jgi:CRISPR-associated endonuclease/helicase Cas3
MMVTFVSQCEKNALKKTRRVLDAYANRIGTNTWQTVITNEGLSAVKKLLRKTASKSTAVSCHWLRSRSRSELAWVVGKRDKFNLVGVVPVNSTKVNRLNYRDENDWQYLPLIQSLAAVAALFHDWGKATALFQDKLSPTSLNRFKGDPIRHEWISCLLLSAFIQQAGAKHPEDQTDYEWLTRLEQGSIDEQQLSSVITQVDNQVGLNPFTGLPVLAKLVAWLIVSHHRLPNLKKVKGSEIETKYHAGWYKADMPQTIDELLQKVSKEWGYENRYEEKEYQQRLKACFNFPKGFVSQSKKWQSSLKKWAVKLLAQREMATKSEADQSIRVVLHHARLCLMLGDHYYSSQDADKKWQDTTGLFANTDRKTNKLKQKLDEHLVGVAKYAVQNAHYLPAFETQPPKANDINSLKKLSPKNFRWQDKAVEKIKQWRDETKQDKYGFFSVNMASTGCGKTFANAKVMRALSEDFDSLRFTLALGLRTLTLQTGDEYRDRIGLDDSELAVLIGSRAVLELHNKNKSSDDKISYQQAGSESQESLLDEEIDFDCDIPIEGLATVLTCERDRKFLYAPVLSCTIDHMMAATETTRGGRYILPSLRMMSSDLVIDEIDDFSDGDLIAIGRLIFFAAMMGRKVMISSATIPPDLAEGYFKAYRDGWQLYAKSRDASHLIGCAWIDEFSTQVISNVGAEVSTAIPQYRKNHDDFIIKRVNKLEQQPAKRKANVIKCEGIIKDFKKMPPNDEETISSKQHAYFSIIAQAVLDKHQNHHAQEHNSQLAISFGVIRVANISPCVDLTQYLLEQHVWPDDTEVRVMAYHSQQVLLLRSEQERHLDQVLKRKEQPNEQPAAFTHPVIQCHIKNVTKNKSIKKLVFILVATPVEEVGRDHDFDWAVIEPSSYRSIIQLAGRVKRHREGEVAAPNIGLLQYNLRGIKESHKESQPVFNRPGFEKNNLMLTSHNLEKLLNTYELANKLDAIPRIQKSSKDDLKEFRRITKSSGSADQLVQLEHVATWSYLANYRETGPQTLQGYLNEAWYLTGLPQTFVRFRDSRPSLNVYLTYLPEKEEFKFCEKDEDGWPVDRQLALGITRQQLSPQAQDKLWLLRDYQQLIEELAGEQERSLRSASMRFGELSFPYQEGKQYIYNDQLGLVKER